MLTNQPAAASTALLMPPSPPVGTRGCSPKLPLLGRTEELATSVHLLHTTARLLTLTGPSGIGKTHLATAIAAHGQSIWVDGVYIVPLASLTDPTLLPAAILHTLHQNPIQGYDPLALLCDSLRHREMLLVLDSFEHLLPAAPLLGTLLTAAPGLKLLVTSQAVLDLYGEYTLPLPPLPYSATSLDAPANALFIQQAQGGLPGFDPTPEQCGLIAEVCARLDGHPLALTLAATHLPTSPLPHLLAHLNAAQLTWEASEPLLPHHRSLREAFDRSYNLLTAAEQALFQRLALFPGPFSLDDALAVRDLAEGASALQDEAAVLGGIATLVAKSLLQPVAPPAGSPLSAEQYFTYLAPLRAYALAHIQTNGGATTLPQHSHQRMPPPQPDQAALPPPPPMPSAGTTAEQCLTAREQQVLRLLAQGANNRAIAAALQVSGKTVEFHISNILGKLGLTSRVQAAAYAIRQGLAR